VEWGLKKLGIVKDAIDEQTNEAEVTGMESVVERVRDLESRPSRTPSEAAEEKIQRQNEILHRFLPQINEFTWDMCKWAPGGTGYEVYEKAPGWWNSVKNWFFPPKPEVPQPESREPEPEKDPFHSPTCELPPKPPSPYYDFFKRARDAYNKSHYPESWTEEDIEHYETPGDVWVQRWKDRGYYPPPVPPYLRTPGKKP
jgi:hypothetical protein